MINEKRLVETFCELVQIDSPSGEEEVLAQHLVRRLQSLGFHVVRDSYGNVIASEPGENPILLATHMDTVHPGRGVHPHVDNGAIRSDGSTVLGGDCKAGIAAVLEALESIKQEKVARMPAQLVFTREEEIGLVGARNLDMTAITANEAIIFDGGGPVNSVTVGSPTHVTFDVEIQGRAAHAGVEPEKGISAIRIASDIISSLPQGRIDEETTFNIGSINGGSVRNAVPETASIFGEYRSRNSNTLEHIGNLFINTLEGARSRYPEALINETIREEYKMYFLDNDNPLVGRISKVLNSIGLNPKLQPSGGGTDANILAEVGIMCVVVGMSAQDMHTVRESVPVLDLVNVSRFCRAFLAIDS